MSMEQETRTLLEHAADQLATVQNIARVRCGGGHTAVREMELPTSAYIAMAYAEGLLRMLATYLTVQPDSSKGGS